MCYHFLLPELLILKESEICERTKLLIVKWEEKRKYEKPKCAGACKKDDRNILRYFVLIYITDKNRFVF